MSKCPGYQSDQGLQQVSQRNILVLVLSNQELGDMGSDG